MGIFHLLHNWIRQHSISTIAFKIKLNILFDSQFIIFFVNILQIPPLIVHLVTGLVSFLQYLCRKLDTLSQDMITLYQNLSNLITMSSDPVVIISISHCSIKMIYLANRNYRIRKYPIKFYN